MDQVKGMARSSQLILGAGLLLFIFLFFSWQQKCIGGFCGSQSGWHGWGTAVGIVLIVFAVANRSRSRMSPTTWLTCAPRSKASKRFGSVGGGNA